MRGVRRQPRQTRTGSDRVGPAPRQLAAPVHPQDQEGLQRCHAIDTRQDAIEASAAPMHRLPSSVRRPTFVR
jgi:hypothetical protein